MSETDPTTIRGTALFVGVDGGGTRCRVRVRDARGGMRASLEAGSANVYLDFVAAVRTIREAIVATVGLAGVLPGAGACLRIGLGLAGVSGPAMVMRVHDALADLGTVTVAHDGDVACLGAHGGRDGGLVIAGTGSAAVARVGGISTSIGGRGFIMGDDGSGARLAYDALRRALRAHDGLEPKTPLGAELMASFDHDPVALIDWARRAHSSDFGRFAPVVFSYAAKDDPVALELVRGCAGAVADMGHALIRLGAGRLSITGGLALPLRPYLPPTIHAVLHEPLLDAQDGALLLAGCPLPRDRAAESGDTA